MYLLWVSGAGWSGLGSAATPLVAPLGNLWVALNEVHITKTLKILMNPSQNHHEFTVCIWNFGSTNISEPVINVIHLLTWIKFWDELMILILTQSTWAVHIPNRKHYWSGSQVFDGCLSAKNYVEATSGISGNVSRDQSWSSSVAYALLTKSNMH